MAGDSRFVEDSILDWLGGTPMPSPPAALFVAVYTAMPAEDGTGGTEQTTSGFSRQLITLGLKATDTDQKRFRQASATVTFGPNSGGSSVGPLVGFGVWAVASGGASSDYIGGDLFRNDAGDPVTKTIPPGDRFELPAGKLKLKRS